MPGGCLLPEPISFPLLLHLFVIQSVNIKHIMLVKIRNILFLKKYIKQYTKFLML
jgi:hypothetical protein